MEQSRSWEGNRCMASREIPHNLWHLKVCYRIHKRLPPVPIPSQINPIHAFLSHVLQIHFYIIIPSMPWSSKWFHSLRSLHQSPVCTYPVPHTCHMPHPSPPWLDHQSDTWQVHSKKLLGLQHTMLIFLMYKIKTDSFVASELCICLPVLLLAPAFYHYMCRVHSEGCLYSTNYIRVYEALFQCKLLCTTKHSCLPTFHTLLLWTLHSYFYMVFAFSAFHFVQKCA